MRFFFLYVGNVKSSVKSKSFEKEKKIEKAKKIFCLSLLGVSLQDLQHVDSFNLRFINHQSQAVLMLVRHSRKKSDKKNEKIRRKKITTKEK